MDSYGLIDKFLRNNLDDEDYAHFSCALDAVYAGQQDDALTAANERIRVLKDQLTAEREVSDKLEKALKRVVGDHNAPNDCYATGPLTGNLYEDLVSCPSCEAESLLAEVAHIRSQEVAAT